MNKKQKYRLKGCFLDANTNLTAVRCSVTSRFGVNFRDFLYFTYVFDFWYKIVINLFIEFIFDSTNVYNPLNI